MVDFLLVRTELFRYFLRLRRYKQKFVEVSVVRRGWDTERKFQTKLNGEYLLNENGHRQSGKDVGKYEGSPRPSKIFMNFRSQTRYNMTGDFTHSP